MSKWNVSTGIQYVAGLYNVEKITENTEKEHFLLWNLRTSYDVSSYIKLFLKAENLLNQNYEINAGFPMPGVTGFGGIRLKI